MNNAKYALITSFKPQDKDGSIKYYFNCLKFFLKAYIYKPFKKVRSKKYQLLFEEQKRYKHTIIGHKSLLLSLFRGFEKLKIPYTYNKITKNTENILLLWADEKDIKTVEKIKAKKPDLKIITAPTACKYDYNYQYLLPQKDCIDKSLVASEWVLQTFKNKIPEKYWEKIALWPSGVELLDMKIMRGGEFCIVYNKFLPINENISKLLEKYNIKYKNLVYGEYLFDDWQNDLRKCTFVIFNQNCIETQGLAAAEAWAANKPTFVQYNINHNKGLIFPYMNDTCGCYYKNIDELENIIKEYTQNKEKFIEKFNPYKFVSENMSDEASVKKLIEIFNQINNKK